MVSVSAEIDQAAVARLDALINRIATEMPGRMASELRRAGIYICKALRKRTKVAPKRIPPREYLAVPSPNPPRYVHSNSAGRHLLRRWSLTKKLGTPDQNTHDYYVYTAAHRGKGGKMVGKSPAAEKRELLKLHGVIVRRGLAKKSWGWVANGLYAGGASGMGDLSWKRRPRDRRDPRDYVRGIFAKYANQASATLENRLDYALDSLPPGALNEGINAAVKRLEYNINNHFERATA